MYTVGQAVILTLGKSKEIMCVVLMESTETLYLSGLIDGKGRVFNNDSSVRPATQSEILAEAQRHGWAETITGVWSPKSHMVLVRSNSWYLGSAHLMVRPTTDTLKEYCEEGLIAHRLITALNLVK